MRGWAIAGAISMLATLASCATTEDKPPRHPEERVAGNEPLTCRKLNADPAANPTAPRFTRIPMGKDLSNNYPAAAAKKSLSGSAVLDCKYKADGSLACSVKSEEPEGWGFGLAALAVAPCFTAVAGDQQTTPFVGGAVEIPISFKR